MDAGYGAHSGVKELGGDGLREWVVAFLLPTTDEVIAIFLDHPVEFGYLVGRVLQVGIHGNNHIALRHTEPHMKGGRFAVVGAERHAVHLGILLVELLDDLPRAVGGAIVAENDLVGEVVLLHHAVDPCGEFGKGLVFVIEWYYDRDI